MTGASVSESVLRLVRQIEEFCAEPARDTGPEAGCRSEGALAWPVHARPEVLGDGGCLCGDRSIRRCGSLSPIHWLRLNCHMTSGAAGDRLAVGEQVASVPQSIEAMAGGDIGFSHLALIAREAIAIQVSG